MADDILNIVVKLGGDVDKLERLKSLVNKPITVQFDAKLTPQLDKILSAGTKGTTVTLNIKAGTAQETLTKVINQLKEINTLSQVQIKTGSTPAIAQRQNERQYLDTLGINTRGLSNQQHSQIYNQNSKAAIDELEKQQAQFKQDRRESTDRALKSAFSNQSKQAKQQQYLASPQYANKQFREGYGLEEANRQFSRTASFDKDAKNRIAYQNNILPSQITSDNSKLFSGERLKDPQAIKEAAFSFLFGKGISGKGAGLAGSLIGGSVGPGGALVGAAIGQVAAETAVASFEAVAEALRKASESALDFERSIAGTTGALLGTTRIVTEQGAPVSPAVELQEQRRRAVLIQRSSRAALAPLGVGGAEEAQFTQAYGEGVVGSTGNYPSLKEFTTVLPPVVAALKAIAPGLAPARQAAEIARIGSGNAQGPILSRLKTLAPGLFKQGLTEDERIKAVKPLEGFPKALTELGDPLSKVNEIFAKLNITVSDVGDAFLKSLIPGLTKFDELVSDPQVSAGLQATASAVGSAISTLAEALGQFFKALTDPKLAKFYEIVSIIGGAGAGAASGAAAGAVVGSVVPGIGTAVGAGVGAGIGLVVGTAAGLTAASGIATFQQGSDIPGSNGNAIPAKGAGLKSVPAPESALTALLNKYKFGTGEEKKAGQISIDQDRTKLAQYQVEAAKAALQELGKGETAKLLPEDLSGARGGLLNVLETGLEKLEKETAKTFETSTFAGKGRQIQSNIGFQGQEIGIENQQIANTQAQIKQTPSTDVTKLLELSAQLSSEQNKLKETTATLDSSEKEYTSNLIDTANAQRSLRDASEQLAEAQKEEVLRRNELNRSLDEATAKLNEFPDALAAATTGKEQGIIGAAQKVKDLGGDLPSDLEAILSDPELKKAYELKSAKAQLNEQRSSVGLSGISVGGPQDLFGGSGGSFQIGLKNTEEALKDSIDKIKNELNNLGKSVRNAAEALDDLLKTLKPRLDNIPTPAGSKNEPIFGGGKGSDNGYSGAGAGGGLFGTTPPKLQGASIPSGNKPFITHTPGEGGTGEAGGAGARGGNSGGGTGIFNQDIRDKWFKYIDQTADAYNNDNYGINKDKLGPVSPKDYDDIYGTGSDNILNTSKKKIDFLKKKGIKGTDKELLDIFHNYGASSQVTGLSLNLSRSFDSSHSLGDPLFDDNPTRFLPGYRTPLYDTGSYKSSISPQELIPPRKEDTGKVGSILGPELIKTASPAVGLYSEIKKSLPSRKETSSINVLPKLPEASIPIVDTSFESPFFKQADQEFRQRQIAQTPAGGSANQSQSTNPSSEEFVSQSSNSDLSDVVTALKQLPAAFGIQMRAALDNSFSGS